jgi:hypothetical protein
VRTESRDHLAISRSEWLVIHVPNAAHSSCSDNERVLNAYVIGGSKPRYIRANKPLISTTEVRVVPGQQ